MVIDIKGYINGEIPSAYKYLEGKMKRT